MIKFMAFSFDLSMNNITETVHENHNVPMHLKSTVLHCSASRVHGTYFCINLVLLATGFACVLNFHNYTGIIAVNSITVTHAVGTKHFRFLM